MPETFPRHWKQPAIASTFSVWQRAFQHGVETVHGVLKQDDNSGTNVTLDF